MKIKKSNLVLQSNTSLALDRLKTYVPKDIDICIKKDMLIAEIDEYRSFFQEANKKILLKFKSENEDKFKDEESRTKYNEIFTKFCDEYYYIKSIDSPIELDVIDMKLDDDTKINASMVIGLQDIVKFNIKEN